MTYVITQNCCNDASCVPVCPVGCIHPTPDEPDYQSAEMLYIDPKSCIDCGACVDACPVGAVKAVDELTPDLRQYAEINAAYFLANPVVHRPADLPAFPGLPSGRPLRVAIVGAGPAGFYAADELLRNSPLPVEISLIDRLPTPFGLVRAGVAPDHPSTKEVTGLFRWVLADPRVSIYFNTAVGDHVSHDELLEHHHAVIYSYGASTGKRLGIPGEDLQGSFSATEFVGWYNGHPDHAQRQINLSTPRVVVIGNGNVALDIARLLLRDPEELAATDIADHALEALRASEVREVVVLGRRDALHSAFTTPELLALEALDIDIHVERANLDEPSTPSFTQRLKIEALRRIAAAPKSGRRRLVLRYRSAPVEIVGDVGVSAIRIMESASLETGLVLSSVGYQGEPLDGVPFDSSTRTIPNLAGRVLRDGEPLAGVYVGGWIRRGANGVIGTNRFDARETVASVLADLDAGALGPGGGSGTDFEALVRHRRPATFDRGRWQTLDDHERQRGREAGRPSIKVTSTEEMVTLTSHG
jgi:ferredoxin--NADP+ reductase